MQVDVQEYLKLLECTGKILFFDLETHGLNADYGSILVASLKPYGDKPMVFSVDKIGRDKQLTQDVIAVMNDFPMWASYYGRGFDIKYINARCLYHDLDPLIKKPHLDMYFQIRPKIATARGSQGHLLSWLKLPEQKMTVPASAWSEFELDKRNKKLMIDRCNSDTQGLEAFYNRTKKLITEIKK